jgi:RsiW-degrading membrane proteinase PrsW (M82 family)
MKSRCGPWRNGLESIADFDMNPIWIFSVSAIGALVPMLAYTLIVWWLDRHEREPLMLVGLSLLYGAVPAAAISFVLAALAQRLMAPLILPDTLELLAVMLIGPLIEESAKVMPLYVSRNHTNFNNATDGIVYGSAIGFGFGMTENLFYFLGSYLAGGYYRWVWTIMLRTIFSASVHAFTTGLAGYFIGRIKFSRLPPGPMLRIGLAVAVLGHVAWNALVTAISGFQSLSQFQFLLIVFPLVCLCLFILLEFSLLEERRIFRQELAEEATTGVIPAPVLRRMAGSRRRGRGTPLPLHRDIMTLGARLAFKKRERRCARQPVASAALDTEIETLRDHLRRLSQNNDKF